MLQIVCIYSLVFSVIHSLCPAAITDGVLKIGLLVSPSVCHVLKSNWVVSQS